VRRVLLAVATVGAMQLALASAASAITVDTTAMDTTINGNCTLYEAVQAANTNSNVDNCAGANVGSDTIQFSGTGPVTLNAGQMNVASGEPLIINGPASSPGITIEAGSASRIFNAAANLSLNDLTLEGVTASSQDGGAIKGTGVVALTGVTIDGNHLATSGHGACVDAPTITVTNSQLYNNSAAGFGGCLSGGTITVTNSSLASNSSEDVGGAIHSTVLTTVIDSSFGAVNQGNTADGGGAVQVTSGNLVVQNSTFKSNTATVAGTDGGAILWGSNGTATISDSTFCAATLNEGNKSPAGGAIWATAGTLNVNHSLFYSNSATSQFGGGGAIGFTGTGGGTVENTTFIQNLGGLQSGSAAMDMSTTGAVVLRHDTFRLNLPASGNPVVGKDPSGTLTLASTIVDTSGTTAIACNGTIVDGGYNDVFPASSAGTCPTSSTNTTGDPALGSLQDDGGPTQTMMLGSGSAAVDAIPFAQCDVGDDQRGVDRPIPANGACDIGAVEDDYMVDGQIAKKDHPLVGNDIYNDDPAQTVSAKAKPGHAVKFTALVQNDAQLSTDGLVVTGRGGDRHFKVKYLDAGVKVTPNVIGGGYDAGTQASGDFVSLTIVVKVVKGTRAGKDIDLPITVRSGNLPQRSDTVVAHVTSK
jgi:hypothetical protein